VLPLCVWPSSFLTDSRRRGLNYARCWDGGPSADASATTRVIQTSSPAPLT
jgi:hypothetical protein